MHRNAAKSKRKSYVQTLRTCVCIVLCAATILAMYHFFFRSNYFTISEIRVVGAKSFVNKTDIQTVLNTTLLHTNLLLLNAKDTSELLHRNFQGGKEFIFSRFLPSTLEVKVIERVPLALVYNDSSPNYFMIDDDGYILGVVDRNQTNLPQIKYEGAVKVGEFINKELVPAYLELVSALDNEKFNVTSMSFYPKYARIYLSDSAEIFIGNDKNKTQAVKIAGQIKNQVELEKKMVNKIDLRYDKVIVSYD